MFKDYRNFMCWVRRRTQLAGIFHVWAGFIISGAIHSFAISIKPGNTNGYARF